ncbi:MAG TPA: alanine--tRNA ligase, partial [Candidatus Dormibacteraeota bacterium]|nr:alanine--tRNA ligase [Candidatus Dormibacteraeota bacterium]
MLSADIRQSFLNFFQGREHLVLPSSSLVPHGDPSVLLTTAGMQQFKPIFMGQADPPSPRVTTVQKCFRTVDLEEVGDDSHLTFFEMLGNFSFGDYFKDGAIELAWEFLTRELGLDPNRLFPTVHPSDDEAAAIWLRVIGREPHRLEDNFWPANLEGWIGPCGPDSEIYWDWGPAVGCGQADCRPGHCDRFLEVWNLVFMQFDRAPDGSRKPLARTGVDTGMGLERLAAVVLAQERGSTVPVSFYETDLFKGLVDGFMVEPEGGWGPGAPAFVSRLCADHSRGVAFLVADGVRPGNEGRGYILRKMIRRATLHALRTLKRPGALSGEGALPRPGREHLENPGGIGVARVIAEMGDVHPELKRPGIVATVRAEEVAFETTLAQGQREFEAVVARSSGIISGADAFRLHDTLGFPVELTTELAAEAGLGVDRAGFEAALAEQRQMSRRAAKRNPIPRTGLPRTEFVGHESLNGAGTVLRLFAGDTEVEVAAEGDEVELYLDRTPFYAEGGGQVGDIGIIEGPEGTVEVLDVQKQGEAFAHYGKVASGRLVVGQEVTAEVDREARWATMRHHSATHLLHRALRQVLGETTHQQGSYVGPDTCTFDFNLSRAVAPGELHAIFTIVNRAVRDDIERVTRVMPVDEAKATGAMSLFGEKYGDLVRVVSFDDFSVELCGGTHVDRTGQIGLVTPVRESSVGAGVRRIEFLAGEAAERRVRDLQDAALTAAGRLNVKPVDLPRRVDALLDERKALLKQVDDLKRAAVLGRDAATGRGVVTGP